MSMSWQENEYGDGWHIWEQAYAMAKRKEDKQRICDFLRANKELVNSTFSRILLDIAQNTQGGKDANTLYLQDVHSRYNWLY